MLLPPLLPMLLSIVRLGPIQYPEQYIWTNIQEGNVNLKLLFLLLQNDSVEVKKSVPTALRTPYTILKSDRDKNIWNWLNRFE